MKVTSRKEATRQRIQKLDSRYSVLAFQRIHDVPNPIAPSVTVNTETIQTSKLTVDQLTSGGNAHAGGVAIFDRTAGLDERRLAGEAQELNVERRVEELDNTAYVNAATTVDMNIALRQVLVHNFAC